MNRQDRTEGQIKEDYMINHYNTLILGILGIVVMSTSAYGDQHAAKFACGQDNNSLVYAKNNANLIQNSDKQKILLSKLMTEKNEIREIKNMCKNINKSVLKDENPTFHCELPDQGKGVCLVGIINSTFTYCFENKQKAWLDYTGTKEDLRYDTVDQLFFDHDDGRKVFRYHNVLLNVCANLKKEIEK
jgi:hypothetical protein